MRHPIKSHWSLTLIMSTLLAARSIDAASVTAPSLLVATTVSSSEIRLNWTASPPGGAYVSIERSLLATSSFAAIGTSPRGTNSYRSLGLNAGTRYYFRVRIIHSSATSKYSSIASAVTAGGDATAPSVPTGLTASAPGCTQIALKWNPALDTGGSGLASYRLYRGGLFVKQVSATAVSTTDGNLAASTAYSYRVSAVDAAGNESAQSVAASASTPACPTTTTLPGSTPRPPIASAGPDQFSQTFVSLSFDAGGSYDPDGTIVSYGWTFGDGTSATGPTPAHAYATPGTYVVTLTVTDNQGLGASDTASVQATNRPPVANAGPDQTAAPGASITFDGSGSLDPDGVITSLAWDFGDGTSAVGQTVTHAYTTAGTYAATLTATDNLGARANDTATIAVITGSTSSFQWTKRAGSAAADVASDVAVDGAGNVVMTGRVEGAADLGGTMSCPAYSGFVVKFSPMGAPLWSRCFPGGGGKTIAVDAGGNVVVAGYFFGTSDFGGGALTSAGGYDIFIAKYSPTGSHLWSRRFGSPTPNGAITETASALTVDAAGNLVVTGTFDGTADFGGGPLPAVAYNDIFVAKYSAAGAHLWSRHAASAAGQIYGNGVAVDAVGNVVVTGSLYSTADLGGGPLPVVFGRGILLAKFSSLGTHLWSRSYGGWLYDSGSAVAVDGGGDIIMTGQFGNAADFGNGTLVTVGNNDIFLAKFTGNGAPLWSRSFGGWQDDAGTGVAVDANGNIAVTGAFGTGIDLGGGWLASNSGIDMFLAKYAPSGAHLWSQGFGGYNTDSGEAVAIAPGGDVVLAGRFFSSMTIGGSTFTSAGASDIILYRRQP